MGKNLKIAEYKKLVECLTKENEFLVEELTKKKNSSPTRVNIDINPNERLIPLNQYEPKKKNRFLAHFPEIFGIQSWFVSSCQRPNVKINGFRQEYEEITFTFRDPIGPSTTQCLVNILNAVENNTQYNGQPQNELVELMRRGFDCTLEMLDPTGVAIERWVLEGCFITQIDFGPLSYDNQEIVTCTMKIIPNMVKLDF